MWKTCQELISYEYTIDEDEHLLEHPLGPWTQSQYHLHHEIMTNSYYTIIKNQHHHQQPRYYQRSHWICTNKMFRIVTKEDTIPKIYQYHPCTIKESRRTHSVIHTVIPLSLQEINYTENENV